MSEPASYQSQPRPVSVPPGWFQAPQGMPGQLQWWDGNAWGPLAPMIQPQMRAHYGPPQSVVNVPAPYTMTTSSHKETSHGLHLFLTIITAGLWGVFVWLPIVIWHRSHKGEKTVTRVGY